MVLVPQQAAYVGGDAKTTIVGVGQDDVVTENGDSHACYSQSADCLLPRWHTQQ